MFSKFSNLYPEDGSIPFFRNIGMVHMHHHTRNHIPKGRNHVTAVITESNLTCGESHDRMLLGTASIATVSIPDSNYVVSCEG